MRFEVLVTAFLEGLECRGGEPFGAEPRMRREGELLPGAGTRRLSEELMFLRGMNRCYERFASQPQK